MPLTFIDIERQKNWRIGLFFLLLMFFYLCIAALFASLFLNIPLHSSSRFWIFTCMVSLPIAGIHFWVSAYDTVSTVVRQLDAQLPDRQDEIHRVLINVVEEMHIVTGNRRRIQCKVIPSLSMNALSVTDLKGESLIGITEGLLSRLSRPQLESVIAHEAHHILSGDCLETTVASSLFGTFATAIEKLSYTSRGRILSSPAFMLAWVLVKLNYLLNMFISREREYRADAAAVRMTRNPIALAETLHLLSRSWRGAGFIGSGFEMLCIVNPQATALDEAEGFLADLLSTHPPLKKRIDVLLKMARVSITELETKAGKKAVQTGVQAAGPQYYAMNPQQRWQGPFTIAELGALPWLSPLTWVTTGDQQQLVERAWKQPGINDIFTSRLAIKEMTISDYICPVCNQRLVISAYEGTRVFQCRFCAGTLVENDKMARIIARAGQGAWSKRINTLTRTTVNQNQSGYANRMRTGNQRIIPLRACPKCKNSMYRNFYSQAHMIEVDRCGMCGLTWFDQDELSMLQCLIENRIVPDFAVPHIANAAAQ